MQNEFRSPFAAFAKGAIQIFARPTFEDLGLLLRQPRAHREICLGQKKRLRIVDAFVGRVCHCLRETVLLFFGGLARALKDLRGVNNCVGANPENCPGPLLIVRHFRDELVERIELSLFANSLHEFDLDFLSI